jgi:hypothetical protein
VALVGSGVRENVLIVLTDIDFNAGVGNFHNLLADATAGTYDAAMAGFDLVDSARASQVQRDRIVANYEYLVAYDVGSLGRIAAN